MHNKYQFNFPFLKKAFGTIHHVAETGESQGWSKLLAICYLPKQYVSQMLRWQGG